MEGYQLKYPVQAPGGVKILILDAMFPFFENGKQAMALPSLRFFFLTDNLHSWVSQAMRSDYAQEIDILTVFNFRQ